MGLFEWFRKAPPIRQASELAQFMDAQAAFVAQKGVYEYSRARAGHYSKVLFSEQTFIDAVDRSRWQAYPLALAMVGEVAEGVLRPHAAGSPNELAPAISALAVAVLDGHPVPAMLGAERWNAERETLARRLVQVGLHPPKPAKDIPIPYAKTYFDLMPIHEKLRSTEAPTITNYLKITLCNVHVQFSDRIDGPALIKSLYR
jgi:hypothetical protein